MEKIFTLDKNIICAKFEFESIKPYADVSDVSTELISGENRKESKKEKTETNEITSFRNEFFSIDINWSKIQ